MSSTSPRSCTAAARSATSGPAPSTPRRSPASPPAVELAVAQQPDHAARGVRACATSWSRRVQEQVPDAALNGDPDSALAHRLPGNAHLTFPGCEGDSLLMLLDARGIACSTGSACSAGVPQASHVLLAMGCDEEQARSSLRFSLGHTTHRGRRRRARRGHRAGRRAGARRRRSPSGSAPRKKAG